MEGHGFLLDLALVLSTAAVSAVIFRRLNQPVILGYLLAGLVVGPNVPVPVFADPERVHALSELGVILLMFSLGLEFNLRRLGQVAPLAGGAAVIQIGLTMWAGYLIGRGFGWGFEESIYTGAMVALSSTMIVAKTFGELPVGRGTADLSYGILIVQDLVAVLLIALLGAMAGGSGPSGEVLLSTTMRLLGFVAAMILVGYLVIPRVFRLVARLRSPETLLVASVGLCFAFALIAEKVGYSVALGAFLGGTLVSESGEGEAIGHLVAPLRDVFASVFFVSVGMLLDPSVVVANGPAVLALSGLVVVGKPLAVVLGALLSGKRVRLAVESAVSLGQIGEFSFILVGAGVAAGAVGEFLYPVALTVCALTSFLTPPLVRVSGKLAGLVERSLPHPVQTFIVLYGSWLEQLGQHAGDDTPRRRTRRLLGLIAVDVGAIVVLVVLNEVVGGEIAAELQQRAGLGEAVAERAVQVLSVVLALPFAIGLYRCVHSLGIEVARRVFPEAEPGHEDFAATSRRSLVMAIQLLLAMSVGAPLLALTQPFLPPPWGALLLVALVVALGIAFWRRAIDLEGQVRAGAQSVLDVLSGQAPGAGASSGGEEGEDEVSSALGTWESVRIEEGASASGRSLSELDLRTMTGADVVAIQRGDQGIVAPDGREVLQEHDRVALAGSREAIREARAQLRDEPRADVEARSGPGTDRDTEADREL